MDTNTATLQLPKDLIESAVKQHVATAIHQALDGGETLVRQLISQVMNRKVDSSGQVSNYNSENRYNWLEISVHLAIQQVVKDTLTDEIGKYKDVIREHLIAELGKKRSPLLKQLVEAMASGLVSAGSSKWGLTVTFPKD